MKKITPLMLGIFISSIMAQVIFTEDFETDLSKWDVMGSQTGNVEISNFYLKTGSHSLMIKTSQVGGTGEAAQKYVRHTFGAPVIGVASVWFYDTGNPNAALVVLKDAAGNDTSIGRMDAADSKSPNYVYKFIGTEYPGSVSYSVGWHSFSFSVSNEGTKYSIDGTVQTVNNPYFRSFSEIQLGTFSGRSTEQYWDDVTLSPLCTIPSPSITSPAANYVFPTSRPSFEWSTVSGAESYTIQILSGNDILAEKTGIAATTYTTESDLPQGSYTFRVKSVSSNCESDWSSLAFLLGIQSSSITVNVKTQGAAVADATVSLIPDGQLPYFFSVKTDVAGQAVFQNIAAGSYTLKVEKEQYAPYVATLTVNKSLTIDVELSLPPLLIITSDKETYNCDDTITLTVKGSPDASIALMVKLGDEVVYTDTVKTDNEGKGNSSFAISREGTLVATVSAQGATAETHFSVTCAPTPPSKILIKIMEYKVTDASGRPLSVFTRGQMASFYIVIKNESSKAATVLVLNQVKDPKLISVFTGFVKVTLAPGEIQEISLGFTLPSDANAGSYSCQAMVWSDWASAGGIAYDSTDGTFDVEALV